MGKIVKKKEAMKKQMEDMAAWELEKIKRIHANMPRHMQDVLKFDGKTVHIAQERQLCFLFYFFCSSESKKTINLYSNDVL